MNWDYEAQREKEGELLEDLRGKLEALNVPDSESTATARVLFQNFVRTSPPEEETVSLGLVTVSSFSGRGGGTSSKLGNIRLNIGTLFEAIAAGVFTTISTVAAPWAIPFAAILLWCSLQKITSVDLTEESVIVLYILHRLKDRDKHVPNDVPAMLAAINAQLQKHGRSQLSESDVRHSLNVLMKIDAIEKNKSGGWFVRECIQVKYR